MEAQDVSGIKSMLTQMGYWNDDFKGASGAGISDCGGIINHSWTFLFYDYGDNKESLDRMMPIFIPDDFDTYKITDKANYIIYEKVNEYDNYCLYVRVDNTLLYVIGPVEDKADIQTLASELGYYKE